MIDILGLKTEKSETSSTALKEVMQVILDIRTDAKNKKDFATSDKIRDELLRHNITIKDTKEGTIWNL